MRILLLIFLIAFTADSSQSQVKKKRASVKTSNFTPLYFIGPVAQFNNITGVELEVTMKNKNGSSSKSTFSLIGGYASRYGKVDFIKPIIFSNETIEIKAKKTEWIHGLGGAMVLNNYIESFKNGFYWSVGVSGNYFFKKGIATSYIDSVLQTDGSYETREVNYKTTNLKTMTVFLITGYKYNLTDKYALKPNLGLGIMGSPFRSSSASAINGFFVNAGCSVIFKL